MAQELRLELLGGLQITHNGVALSAFVSSKVPALLCYLAVTGRPHFRSTLAGLLWSDLPEEAARRNLRVVLADLRQTLAPYLVITRDTIAFDQTSAYWLDVEQLEDALHDIDSTEPDRVRAAVALYTGDFLEGFYVRDTPLFDEWATVQRERLRQLVLHGLYELARTSTTRHEFAAGIDACTRLLQLDPWREDAHRQLMLLLAQRGQRDAALAQYQTCRQIFKNEFDAEPSPETTALYEQIRASELQAPVPALTRASNLPTAPTALLGRGDERARITALLTNSACRLVTLVGPGGMGKTRLALEVATGLRDAFAEVCFVDLAPIRAADRVPATIARTLAVREASDQPLLDSVKDYLRDKHALLLLDNFEQVILAAPLVAELLAACPNLTVLATSRQELHLRGEHAFPVPPLKLPEPGKRSDLACLAEFAAVALFVERATQHQPNFILSAENAATVVEICQRLDGLPLAIELAAARIRLFPPAALLQRLSNRLGLLTRGPHDLPARQQTLQNTIDWSYNMLADSEQRLFARLAVFVGGWTLAAADEVCSERGTLTHSVQDNLQGLLDKHLVQQELRADGWPRFTMLETIREYAQARLVQLDDATLLRQRHAAYYLALVEPAVFSSQDQSDIEQLAQIEAEYDNVRAALRWMLEQKDSEGSIQMCNALHGFWHSRGHVSEGRNWLRAALAVPYAVATSNHVDSFAAASGFAVMQGDWAEAITLLEEALTISRALGDVRNITELLSKQGWLALMSGKYGEATKLFEESLPLCRTLGDQHGIALCLGYLGQAAYEQGGFAQAVPLLTEGLAISRALGDHIGAAWSLNKLGLVAMYQGDLAKAERPLEESLSIFAALEHKGGIAWGRGCAGWVCLSQGVHTRAAELFKDSLTRYSELGEKRNIAFCLERLGCLAVVQQQTVRAARLFGAAKNLRQVSAAPLPPVDQEYYEPYLAMLREQLDDTCLATAWAEGEALSLGQATDYALEGDA